MPFNPSPLCITSVVFPARDKWRSKDHKAWRVGASNVAEVTEKTKKQSRSALIYHFSQKVRVKS